MVSVHDGRDASERDEVLRVVLFGIVEPEVEILAHAMEGVSVTEEGIPVLNEDLIVSGYRVGATRFEAHHDDLVSTHFCQHELRFPSMSSGTLPCCVSSL